MTSSFGQPWNPVLSGRSLARSIFLLVLAVIGAAALAPAQTYTPLHFFNSNDGCLTNYPNILAQGRDGNLYSTTVGCSGNAPYGAVFMMTPSGTFTVLHAFTGTDGSVPVGGLTLGTDGNFYGTTETGGTYGYGTIFKITPSGTLTTLHNFANSGDGVYPPTPPVQGANASFYGTTHYGTTYSITSSGTFKPLPGSVSDVSLGPLLLASDGNFYGTTPNRNTVFRLSASGTVKTIYTFDGTHGARPDGGLVQGSDGNLYGTTGIGGTAPNPGGVVFKLTLTGKITVLHNFDYQSRRDGFYPIAGLVAGSDGNFYGVTESGPVNGYGVLFKISNTGTYSVLYDFDNTNGGNPYSTPMQHTNGLIYGTTPTSASGYGVLYSLNNSLKSFVALMTTTGAAGQTVEILGTGLTGTTAVNFGSGSASFTVVSDSYMTAVVPSGGTTGYVTVTTPSGTLTSNKKFMITPAISSFTPTSGPVGTVVTIMGTGLMGTTQVTFGGVKATNFTVNSGTRITATVPTGAVTGKIGVKTPGGSASSKSVFTVQ